MPGTRTLDFDLLRCFVTIAETRSFTRAGERLGRTQSTISLQVKRLEDQIGRAVFARTPRSLSLTSEGERLLGPARQLLRLNDAAIAELFEPDMTGRVRIGVPGRVWSCRRTTRKSVSWPNCRAWRKKTSKSA